MSGSRVFSKYIVLVLLMSPSLSWAAAPTWAQDCEKAGQQSTKACEGAANAAKAGDNAQAAGNMAGAGSSSNVNMGANALQQQGQAQAARLTQAQQQCQQEQEKCKQQCDQEENDRKPREPKTPQQDPMSPAARAQSGQVEQKKQSACIAPIAAIMGDLGKGASDAANAANGANQTGNASMPMPIPIPPKKEDKKEDEKKPDQLQAQLDCKQSGTHVYADCNNTYIQKCLQNMEDSGCSDFSNRYCSNGSVTGTPPPTPPKDDNLMATFSTQQQNPNWTKGKDGEGMGSEFCKKSNAFKYCKVAGRTDCPSCKSLSNPWPLTGEQLKASQNTCPTDPMFLEPAVQAQLNNTTTTPPSTTGNTSTGYGTGTTGNDNIALQAQSMGGGSGGGFGTQSGGTGGAGEISGGGIAEGTPNGMNMTTTGSGGGSSANYQSGSYQPSSRNGAPGTGATAPRGPAGVTANGEVANQYGPSIFTIQTATYRSLCSRNRLMHCRR